MNVKTMFPSKYLSGADLAGRAVVVTIAAVQAESMRDPRTFDQVTKYVVYFEGKNKGLVLNKTLAGQIAQALGADDTDHWAGKKITLYPESLTVAGEVRQAVRAKAANGG